MDSPEDLQFLLSAHRHALTEAEAMESDLDFAFHLQVQEALAASLVNHPSSSIAVTFEPPTLNDDVLNATSIQLKELEKMETEMKDREYSERVMREARDDLNRRIHDQKMASEILNMPEDEWEQWGGNFEKPFGEGSSSSGSKSGNDEGVSLRGLVRTFLWLGLVLRFVMLLIIWYLKFLNLLLVVEIVKLLWNLRLWLKLSMLLLLWTWSVLFVLVIIILFFNLWVTLSLIACW